MEASPLAHENRNIITNLREDFRRHGEKNEAQLLDLADKISTIKDNHLAHLDEKVVNLDKKVEVIGTDVNWLKRFFWIIATASVGGLVAGVINLLEK